MDLVLRDFLGDMGDIIALFGDSLSGTASIHSTSALVPCGGGT